jgi:hypothetical protein
LAPAARQQDVAEFGGLSLSASQVRDNFGDTLRFIGFWPLVFACSGLYDRVVRPFRKREQHYQWCAPAALLLGFLALRFFVSAAADSRHLVLVIPPTLLFAAAGVSWFVQSASGMRVGSRLAGALIGGALIWAFAVNVYHPPKKKHYGFDELAESLVSRADIRHAIVLVSSDSKGEGALIAELAMREKRPGHTVLRASKELAFSNWMGSSYTVRHQTKEELLQYLEKARVEVVVIDPVFKWPEDQRLLRMLPGSYPDRFQLLGIYPQRNSPDISSGNILFYQFKSGQAPARGLQVMSASQ